MMQGHVKDNLTLWWGLWLRWKLVFHWARILQIRWRLVIARHWTICPDFMHLEKGWSGKLVSFVGVLRSLSMWNWYTSGRLLLQPCQIVQAQLKMKYAACAKVPYPSIFWCAGFLCEGFFWSSSHLVLFMAFFSCIFLVNVVSIPLILLFARQYFGSVPFYSSMGVKDCYLFVEALRFLTFRIHHFDSKLHTTAAGQSLGSAVYLVCINCAVPDL